MNSTIEKWLNYEEILFEHCSSLNDYKCLNNLLFTEKDIGRIKQIKFYLVNSYMRNGMYDEAKSLLLGELDSLLQLDIDGVEYADYKLLEVELYYLKDFGEYILNEKVIDKLNLVLVSTKCNEVIDFITVNRRIGEYYLMYKEMTFEAEKYLDAASSYWLTMELDSFWLPPLFYDFAIIKLQREEYQIAEQYIKDAILIAKNNPTIYAQRFITNSKSVLSSIYLGWHKDEKALGLLKEVVSDRESSKRKNYDDLLIDYERITDLLFDKNQINEAEFYLKKLKEAFKKAYYQDSLWLSVINRFESKIYLIDQNYNKALESINTAYSFIDTSLDYTYMELKNLLDAEADILIAQKELKAVFELLTSSEKIKQVGLDKDINRAVLHYTKLGDLAHEIIEIDSLYFDQESPELQYYKIADSLLNQIRIQNVWRQSSTYLVEHFRSLVEKTLESYFNAYQRDKSFETVNEVFNLMERNNALLLNEENKNNALTFSDKTSAAVIKELKTLANKKEELLYLINTENNPSDKLKLDKVNKEYDKVLLEIDASNNRFDVVYLADWNYQLDKMKSDWISYFVGEFYIYYLFKSDDVIQFKRVKRTKELDKHVFDLIEFLKTPKNKHFEKYEETALHLYQTLIPIEIQKSKNENIVIHADGYLYFLPFEALITASNVETKSSKSANYWIKTKNIRYGYSAALWNISKTKPNAKLLLAVYNDDDNPLIAAEKESVEIKAVWSGKTSIVNDKAAFLKEIELSDVIHIASHAKADTVNVAQNKLYFCSDNTASCVLNGFELTGKKLQNKIVVLNGCETNFGKEFKGEGVFSLARDFAKSGALTSISNLWKVNDFSAQQLLQDAYKNWNPKNTLSASLRTAKLDYIANTHAQLTHPYYWAGTVIVGEGEMERRGSLSYLIVTFLILSFLIAVYKLVTYKRKLI